eukprot:TRINITY_DN5104_c0_g1_i3.p1 TRINITY_DN5104_c0_g1~~TRINITY_DN5104_c0_g1_i3.p1  ORF type:complete len:318 (+),score=66.78 TRINITY_DN5104_c0_g1_i3:886-1839(+)
MAMPNYSLPLQLYHRCRLFNILFPFVEDPMSPSEEELLNSLFSKFFQNLLPYFELIFPEEFKVSSELILSLSLVFPLWLHLQKKNPDLLHNRSHSVHSKKPKSLIWKGEKKKLYMEGELDIVSYQQDKQLNKFVMDWVTRHLRLKREDARTAYQLLLSAITLPEFIRKEILCTSYQGDEGERVKELCSIIRNNISAIGMWVYYASDLWATAIILGLTLHSQKHHGGQNIPFDKEHVSCLLKALKELDVHHFYEQAVILSGEEIMAALDLGPSPVIGVASMHLLEWQFRNSKATKQEAEIFVRNWFLEITSPNTRASE